MVSVHFIRYGTRLLPSDRNGEYLSVLLGMGSMYVILNFKDDGEFLNFKDDGEFLSIIPDILPDVCVAL